MATTPAIGSTTRASDAAKTPPTNPLGQLGKDDFLKLMVAQLQHQDPSNPMDDKAFMGQMAQFATLEQITNATKDLDALGQSSQISQSFGLIGHMIGFVRADGSQGSGVAGSVSVAGGQISIKVGSEEIAPKDVTTVGALASDGTEAALGQIHDALDALAKQGGSLP